MTVGTHILPNNLYDSCSEGMLYCFGQWAFNVTGGWFWTMMLLAFSIVLVMATQKLGFNRAFGFGSFAGLIGAVFLAILGFIPWFIASAFILVGVIGIAIMIMSER